VSGPRTTLAPGADAIERIARDVLAKLPEEFADQLGNVVIGIQDFADDATLDALGLDDPFQLSGVYQGRPLTERSSFDTATLPDMIRLFRRPLLDEWAESGETLEAIVGHVLIHEIGHHFGLSDADMHALEQAAD